MRNHRSMSSFFSPLKRRPLTFHPATQILILRSDFSLARTKLDELIAHLRDHDLWDPSPTGGGMYAARVCLHQGHLAQATGGLTKAVQCYRVCAWIASGRKEAHDAGKKTTPVMKDQFLYIAARACDIGLRLGMLRGGRSFAQNADEEDVEEDMTEEEVRRLASSVAKECRGMGSMLESVGQVIEACLSTEIVKAKYVRLLRFRPISSTDLLPLGTISSKRYRCAPSHKITICARSSSP